MTEEWKKIIIRYHYIVVCILMGLLVLGGVFVGSIQTDLNTAEKHFSDTISYIKEQCTGYDNLNLASETKSLMRVMENVQHLCSDIERERELDDSFVLDDAAVAQYLRSYTITGALLLTPEGKVECSASTDGLTDDPLTTDELPQTLSRTTLLNVADHPQQVYAGRVELEDGSYVDIAACARTDKRGVLVVYYHTTEEYVRNYNLSYQNIVQGYSPQVDGTIVVTRGDQIVASNDASLLGTSVDDMPVLAGLKTNGTDGKCSMYTPAGPGRGAPTASSSAGAISMCMRSGRKPRCSIPPRATCCLRCSCMRSSSFWCRCCAGRRPSATANSSCAGSRSIRSSSRPRPSRRKLPILQRRNSCSA